MPASSEWDLPPGVQPKPRDYAYDLDQALSAVVGLRVIVPADAMTAETLGTERAGNGVLIRKDGLVLTVGYLITEAETIWLHLSDGRVIPGHALAYDQETGFGLVMALEHVDLPALTLGQSRTVRIGDAVVVAGAGGRHRSVAAQIVAKQQFAGYWEYVLDEAIFTAPGHPNWGGTAVIGPSGELIGIGSLQLQQAGENAEPVNLNMIVPIDLLRPILDDLLMQGRPNHPPRPWLGIYATEMGDRVVIAGLASTGPARRAGLQTGDVVLSVAGHAVGDLAELYRRIWACGPAGVEIPMRVERDGQPLDVKIMSADRNSFLKTPRMH
jgi:S1-C subfamily serine protease